MPKSHRIHYARWVRNWRQTAHNLHELCADAHYPCIRVTRFGSRVGQIGSKLDKSGTLSDQISVHLTHQDLKKIPDFSHLGPIWTNLNDKFDVPARICYLLCTVLTKWLHWSDQRENYRSIIICKPDLTVRNIIMLFE